MRPHSLLFLAALALPLAAEPVLYAGACFTQQYVVGARLPESGLFQRTSSGGWQHIGYRHPFIFRFVRDARDPASLLVAAGNGLLRVGRHWMQLTGSDITELRDVAVDPRQPGTVYFGYVNGIRVTHDNGQTWQEIGGALPRRFTETIRVDGRNSAVLAGTANGIYRTTDTGRTWTLAGAEGLQVTRLEASPHDACYWLATTQQGGLFASHDCGLSFENTGRLGVSQNLYDIAFDPTDPQRIAVAGWGLGVAVSTDAGKTWQIRNNGLPRPEATALTFDPTSSGRLYVGIHEDGVYVSGDAGRSWRKDGLDGSQITNLRFLSENRP